MNRIDQRFRDLKRGHRKALIGYITAGHPTLASLAKLVPLLENAGLDILELGVPFSDPIADGPTIQQSSQIALKHGASLRWILSSVKQLRKTCAMPLVLMSYANPIMSMGIDAFFEQARLAGVDGLIIPDIIPEEAHPFVVASRRTRVHLIHLVAPTTPVARIRKIGQSTRGFLYAVSLTGVTGARQSLPVDIRSFLTTVRRATPHPVAVGFGISTPLQAKTLSAQADGVIVGSALIKEIDKSKSQGFAGAARFVRSLRHAIDSTSR